MLIECFVQETTMTASGMDAFEALKAITIHPAKHLGIADRVGSIEVGKDGDFVISDGNIMDSATKVNYTIVNGTVAFSLAYSYIATH